MEEIKKIPYFDTKSPYKNSLKPVVKNAKERILADRAEYLETYDSEALHDLRVGTRRYLALLTLLVDFADGKSYKALVKELKRIMKNTGVMREIDVFKEHLPDANLSETEVELVLSRVDEVYSNRREDLLELLNDDEYVEFLNDLDFQTIMLLEEREESINEISQGFLDNLYMDISNNMLNRDVMEIDELHKVRISAKVLRYNVDLLKDYLDESYIPIKDEAKNIQDILGEVCDRNFIDKMLEIYLR